MQTKSQNTDKFRFITKKTIRKEKYELTEWQARYLQQTLPKNIYWCQLCKGGLVLFNWTLTHSFLIEGADSANHRALLDEFTATIPQAA